MRRSVSWHFLLYSLAIILVAIVAVGIITLILVNANFSKQEEQYLIDRADELVEPLQSALGQGSDPVNLQGIASMGLLAGHMRIRVVDSSGRLLADSGSYDELFERSALEPGASPVAAFQLFLDDSGRYRGFRMPADHHELFDPFRMSEQQRDLFETLPFSAELSPQPPIADVSDAAVSLPLEVDDEVVGHAVLSEGPAFGQAIRDTLQQALLIGGLVALVVAAIAAIVAARQVTRPLLSLGSATDEMAHGNLQARASGSKLAEIDHLATQFNTMADQLEKTIASLESERSALRRFIADASHELRTPLTALKTFNSILAADLGQEEGPTAELLRESASQLDQLDQLTTDLLDLSRLEARLNGFALAPDDIRPVIEEAVLPLRKLSLAKGQILDLDLPQDAVIASHDPVMLQRALQNLVANAIKFTPEGGLITVNMTTDDTSVSIHVLDNGWGIARDEQPFIFDRFYRGRGVRGEGSGLGLAISREIATIHDGTISFTSEERAGSHFILTLPRFTA